MKKRLFIAIHLPDDFKQELIELDKNDTINKILENTRGRFTKKENLHITLSFLDTLDEKLIDQLKNIIDSVSQNIAPFKIEFKDIILGPPGKLSRMIWAVFYPNQNYVNLKNELNQKIVDFLKREKHPIYLDSRKDPIIHITIARFRIFIKSAVLPKFEISTKEMPCDSVSLMESMLSGNGPIYTEIAKSKFLK